MNIGILVWEQSDSVTVDENELQGPWANLPSQQKARIMLRINIIKYNTLISPECDHLEFWGSGDEIGSESLIFG